MSEPRGAAGTGKRALKTLFVIPPYRRVGIDSISGIVGMPTGVAQVAAYLNRNGLKASVLDARALGYSWRRTARVIKDSGADIIGIGGAVTPGADEAAKAARLAKAALPDSVILAGGPHYSYLVDEALDNGFDIVVRGEGEITTAELVLALSERGRLDGVKGIAYREQGKTILTEARPPVENLDALPWPEWNKLPMNRYRWFFKKPKNIFLHTGRGCDNACGFCAIPVYFGPFRAVSGRRVFDEVKTLVADYGVRVIYFVDDNFLCDPARIREYVDLMLEARLPVKWFFQTRAGLIVDNKELVRDAWKAGARLVLIGAESASQDDLDRINKDQEVSTVIEAVRFMHEIGISVWASYTFAPEEVATSLPQTLRFAKRLNTAIASFAPLTAYPGTAGWERTKPLPSSYRYLDMYTVPRDRGDSLGRAVDKAVFRAHLTYGARPSYWRRYLFSGEPLIRKVTRRIVFGGFLAIASRRLKYLFRRRKGE